MAAEIRIPPLLSIGGGAFREAAGVLLRLNAKRPLIVTDAFMVASGLVDQLEAQLRAAGLSSAVFHETLADPTSAVVDQGVQRFQQGGHDGLVSLGGGSPIDTAKAIGMLARNGGRCRDYKAPNAPRLAGPPHLAIPTTAGTGSEVTRFTVISDVETQEKMLISGDTLLPSAAVVDFELTLSMPARLTADTGTDSLTHAIEAYVSRRANPFTDAFALAAMQTIWRELPIAYREPNNRSAREAMMLAATQAGIAFSNASVALVHGMSRPLGVQFHIPHGLSNAMLLPVVTAFSVAAAEARYAACARAIGIAASDSPDARACEQLVEGLFRRNAELSVPSPQLYGIDRAQYLAAIPLMTEQALASGSPGNNPRVPTAGEIELLYRQAWE